MKKMIIWLVALLIVLTSCAKQQAEIIDPVDDNEIQLIQVPGLPDEKWLEQEPEGDEVRRFDLAAAYYYNATDYLVYGDSCTRAGRQSKIFRLAAGEEPEQLCVWPEDSLHEYTDFVSSYYLPACQTLVLYNQQQQKFLLYDNAAGTAQEVAPPLLNELTPKDTVFWLGEGKYLFCCFWQDEQELQRVSLNVSLYDTAGGERQLAELSGGNLFFAPPDEAHPERWLLLTEYGDLCELSVSAAGDVQVRRHRCYEEWPTTVPWLVYDCIQPVTGASGDYAALRVWCEDGAYYQIVDLAGGVLGECAADDDNGGGLLAAYGDTIYFSEYYTTSADACQIAAYNYSTGSRQVVFSTAANGLAETHPGLWGFACGAVSPDGRRLLALANEYVLSLPLLKNDLP